MAGEVPPSAYEAATAEGRERLRIDRRKILASLPQGKISQDYLANVASHILNIREEAEDLVLLIGGMDANERRTQALQTARRQLEAVVKLNTMAIVAATDGMGIAQQIYNPEPKIEDMDDESAKLLKELRKKREASKKKESADSGRGSWKWGAARRTTPYSYASGGPSGGGGGVGNWALQQLLTQQLTQQQQQASGGQADRKKEKAAAVSPGQGTSRQTDPAYTARMMAGRLAYPCHGCGVVGHWKKGKTTK
jgi:hypothetical protein